MHLGSNINMQVLYKNAVLKWNTEWDEMLESKDQTKCLSVQIKNSLVPFLNLKITFWTLYNIIKSDLLNLSCPV